MKQYHKQRITAITAPHLWHCLFGIVGFFFLVFQGTGARQDLSHLSAGWACTGYEGMGVECKPNALKTAWSAFSCVCLMPLQTVFFTFISLIFQRSWKSGGRGRKGPSLHIYEHKEALVPIPLHSKTCGTPLTAWTEKALGDSHPKSILKAFFLCGCVTTSCNPSACFSDSTKGHSSVIT